MAEDWADPEDLIHRDRKISLAERKLWAAVLTLAVDDARGGKNRPEHESTRHRRLRIMQAQAWMAWDGCEAGSFLWILLALGMRGRARAIRCAVGL